MRLSVLPAMIFHLERSVSCFLSVEAPKSMSATRRPVVNRTLMLMLLALAACVPSHAQSPLFTQCPHIGLSTGCAYLVVVMDGATNVLADPS
jgi:hypothetical protein